MEYIQKIFKRAGWISIIESLIVAILGGLLIWKPEEVANIIFYVFGAMFIIVGIVKTTIYFYSKKEGEANTFNLVYGILLISIGIIVIICSSAIGTILRVAIGIWIIYCAILRIIASLKLKEINFKLWIFTLIVAIIMLGCGIYITVNSGIIILTIGILMLSSSIIDIIEEIIFMTKLKNIE
ncbi:MAG: DUF308 domain-containing protein [Clostridia bacterium]|nr:DUF308 domain-containing protein [Clostridia bacterium]